MKPYDDSEVDPSCNPEDLEKDVAYQKEILMEAILESVDPAPNDGERIQELSEILLEKSHGDIEEGLRVLGFAKQMLMEGVLPCSDESVGDLIVACNAADIELRSANRDWSMAYELYEMRKSSSAYQEDLLTRLAFDKATKASEERICEMAMLIHRFEDDLDSAMKIARQFMELFHGDLERAVRGYRRSMNKTIEHQEEEPGAPPSLGEVACFESLTAPDLPLQMEMMGLESLTSFEVAESAY